MCSSCAAKLFPSRLLIPVPAALTSVDGSSFPGAGGEALAGKSCDRHWSPAFPFPAFPWLSAQPPATLPAVDGSRKKIFLFLCDFCSGWYFPAAGSWSLLALGFWVSSQPWLDLGRCPGLDEWVLNFLCTLLLPAICKGNTWKCPWGRGGGMLPANHTSQQSKSCGTNWCLTAKGGKWLLIKGLNRSCAGREIVPAPSMEVFKA